MKLDVKTKKIPIYSRAEVLADVVSLKKILSLQDHTQKNDYNVASCKILSDQKLDPTIINGGVIKLRNSNAKLGRGGVGYIRS